MANVLAPTGFTPIKRVDGASWTGSQSIRKIASNNSHYFFKGDPVISLSTGYIDVIAAASLPGNAQVAGIFMGCEYLSIAKGYVTWSPMFPGGDAASDVLAYIIDDPMVVFAVQSANSNTTATPIPLSSLGKNGNFGVANTIGTSTAGNTGNGISGCYFDQYLINTTTNLPFRIYDIPNVQVSVAGLPGSTLSAVGAIGNGYDPSTAYNIVFVTFNSQDLRAPQAGI